LGINKGVEELLSRGAVAVNRERDGGAPALRHGSRES